METTGNKSILSDLHDLTTFVAGLDPNDSNSRRRALGLVMPLADRFAARFALIGPSERRAMAELLWAAMPHAEAEPDTNVRVRVFGMFRAMISPGSPLYSQISVPLARGLLDQRDRTPRALVIYRYVLALPGDVEPLLISRLRAAVSG